MRYSVHFSFPLILGESAQGGSMFKESVAKMIKIIVVGDVKHVYSTLASRLLQNCDVLSFNNGDEAMTALTKQDPKAREGIRLIICKDNRQDIMVGTQFLERSISMVPRAKRILLVDSPHLDMDALYRAQLYCFITKPYTLKNFISTIKKALEETGKDQPFLRDMDIVGQNPRFLEVLDLVRRVSDSNAPVLVRGETGTGKELIAYALHLNGPGKNKPYVTVNCSAMPETLFEAEMFGHKKGAFTNAYQDRKGRVAQAEGGTLFIDEVAEIPLQVQAKLLRFIQFKEFQPVGNDKVETANVRIVAATNRNLEKKINEGSFREDLYYRLKVLEVELPPLRERPSDIHLLANAFIKKYWTLPGSPCLKSHALEVLEAYDYPGNVRELENVIQRACLLTRTEEIDLDAIPPELIKKVRQSIGLPPKFKVFPRLDNDSFKKARNKAVTHAKNQVEGEFLDQLMARFNTVSAAALHAGMQRTYLHSLLTKHGRRCSK